MTEQANLADHLPERRLPATEMGKLPMGRYPLDVVVVGREWDGWQGLRDYHPALINDTLAVRLVMGGNNSALRGGRRVRTRYATFDPETVSVRPLRTVEFTRVGVQLIDAVADGSVKIAPEAKAALPKAERYRVACPATGCSFLITPDQIDTFEQGSEPEGTIKLSRYQRILLRLHPPMELDEVLHGTLSEDVREVIDQFYRRESGRGPRRRDVDLEYHHEQQIMRVLNASNFFAVTIAPFDEDPAHSVCLECDDETRPKRAAWNTVARFYLGSRSHTLRVTRPYDIDEARSVVRLSGDTMYSLGIEETDSVRISYGGRAITARAMSITDEDRYRQHNYMARAETVDAVVGIPASLRTQLGVSGIHECVEVERDVNHLLGKSLNVYVLSALAWLFTVLQVVPASARATGWTVALFVLSLPLIFYVAAAPRRAQVRDVGGR